MITQSPSRHRSSFGRAAKSRAFSAAIVGVACLALACGDDDPALQTGIGGSAGDLPDASVRDLPGDGLERTPDFDIDSRQREPIGPQRLNDILQRIRDGLGPDAGAPDGAAGAPSGDGAAPDGGAG